MQKLQQIANIIQNNKNIAYFMPLNMRYDEFFYTFQKDNMYYINRNRTNTLLKSFSLLDETISILVEDASQVYLLKHIKTNTSIHGIKSALKEYTNYKYFDDTSYMDLSGQTINNYSDYEYFDNYLVASNGITLIDLSKKRCVLFTLLLETGCIHPEYRIQINSFIIDDNGKLIELTNSNASEETDSYLLMIEGVR